MKYEKYLHTSEWNLIKHKVLYRDSYKCTKCGSNILVNVHHLNYDHIFKEYDYLSDLTTLCKKCHQKIHNTGYFSSKGVTQDCLLRL